MGLWRAIQHILLVKSFLLGALVFGLWVRSNYVADSITAEAGLKSTSLTSANGVVIYRASADGSDALSLSQMKRRYATHDPDVAISLLPSHPDLTRNLGFSYHRAAKFEEGGGLTITLTIPHWLFFLLASSKAVFWVGRRGWNRMFSATNSAWCAICQSDRSQTSGRCVRCGTNVFNRSEMI